jgi:proteasome beta subunit
VVTELGAPETSSTRLMTGTTTIGLVAKEGVVMASERRATDGNFIANKATVKVFSLDKTLAATIAGGVGDAQALIRYLRAEVALYRLRRGTILPVEGAATMLANILSGSRYYPYYAWMIVGGVDSRGSHVFSVDPAGGCMEDRFVSVGSGSPFAYGLLEEGYSRDMAIADGVDLALRALTASMKRDSASGDGYIIHTITPKEYHEYTDDEVARRLKALKIPLPPALP